MKKSKSLLAIILCLAMLFTFAGCGEQQTVSTFTETEDEWETEVIEGEENITGGEQGEMINTTVSQGDSAATAALAKNKEFLNSLKGLVINIYTQQVEKPTRGTTSGDRYYAILSKVAKKYGVTINYLDKVPGDLQQSILAGKPIANVIGVQDYLYASWMNAGVAADLTAAMKKTGISFKESWYNTDATKIGNINGKQYGFNSDVCPVMMLCYNKRLIQENGLEDPIKLYKSGKWTFDKLKEYLKKMKKISSDGKVITQGLGSASATMLLGTIIGANDADGILLKDGKFVQNLGDKKVKNALNYFSDMTSVDKTAISYVQWDEAYNQFSKGNIAMVLATKYIFSNINNNNMVDAVGVVPFPYGPDASASTKNSYQQVFMNIIPKSEEKNADKILFVMNEIYKELYAVREDDFNDDFRTLIRDNDSFSIFKDYTLGVKQSKLSNWNVSGILWTGNKAIGEFSSDIAKGIAVETAINKYSVSIETALNDTWGKWKITG